MSDIEEGNTSYHAYQLLDSSGAPVSTVESLKYKLSDGEDDLILWTDLELVGTGTIEIPGLINRVGTSLRTKRYLTLFAVHDNGKHLIKEISYTIKNLTGII